MKFNNLKIAKLKIENLDFSYRVLLSIIFVLGAILIIFIRLQSKPEKSFAAWFDDAYTYRQTITITHNANIFANRAIGVSVSTSGLVSASKMQSDCDDTRFTDSSGQVLVYQLVSGCNTTNTQYTVVVPRINSGTNYIYVYYGNPTATSNSQDVSGYTTLAPSTAGPAAATEETTPGPLAYWKFNEGVGTTLYDSTQGNNPLKMGTGTTAPTWKTDDQCTQGKCLSFDGNDYLLNTTTNLPNIGNGGTITLSVWLKPTSVSGTIGIFTKGQSGSCFNYGIALVSGVLSARTSGSDYSLTGTLTTGQWQLATIVFDGSGATGYINGQRVGFNASGTTTNCSNNNYALGVRAYNSLTSEFYNGLMDDFKIYPYARSAAQILADYNSRGTTHGSSANLGNLSIADTGPIAYWNFEEGVGTSVYDTGTSAFNGTFGTGSSAPSWTMGKFGKGLSFDGVNDKVVVTQPTTATSNLTLEAWINPSILPQTDGMVINNGTDSAGYGFSVGGAGGSNSKLYMIFNAIVWFDTGYTFPSANTWYHIAATRDTTTWRVYVNGIQTPSTHTQTPNTPTASNFEIGHEPQYSGRHFAGLIDEVKVYNYQRTQKQIIQDMNGGHPAGGSPVGSQVGYWKFDEGVGGTAFNTGSVGSTINANLQTGTSSPTWSTSGVFNKALSFDGNDYLTVPETGDLRFPTTSENFTLSAWVKRSGVGTTQYILSKEDADNDGWRLVFNADNTLTCSVNSTDITSTLTITDTTTWHHVACSVDRSGTGLVYLDGKPASSATTTSGLTLATTTALTIGGRSYTPTFFFNGLIDEVKIYSSQLTASEVLIDYNRGQAIQQGSLSTGAGNTNPNTSGSQEYCVPGDTATCLPPIGEWKFEEGVGTSAYNTGTSGLDGGLVSSPDWSSAKNGKGLTFNGSSNYVQLNSTTLNPLTSDWTETVWVKLPNGSSGPDAILAKRTVGSDASLTIRTNDPNGNTVDCFIDTDFVAYGKGSSKTINDGNWHYIACTRTGNTINLYIDGVLDNATSYTSGTPPASISSANAWQFGRHPAWNFYMNGSIDQVRMYNYARTPAQIAWEYNQGKPSLWYKMDECQGATLYDSIGTGNTGTITIGGSYVNSSLGACAVVDGSSMWYQSRNGKINSSVFTDGFDDNISLGTPSVLNVGATNESYSFAFWVDNQKTSSQILTSGGADCSGSAYPFMFFSDASNFIKFSIYDATNCPSITGSISSSGWHHVVGVRDVTNDKLYLYTDGKLDGSTTDTTTTTTANSNIRYIGQNASANFKWYGYVDDLRFYRYALNATQVQMLYNNGAVNFAPVTGAP